jgi:AcrR family transcriptional regulator
MLKPKKTSAASTAPAKVSASRASLAAPARKQAPSPKPEDDGRRNELIAKSAKLFREKGYDKTTVRDIAAAAGMQAGSWFYHFKTKQDILVAVMEQGMARSLQDIEAISVLSLPPREAFRELVLAHLKTLLAPNNDFIPVLLYEGRSLDKPERAKIVALTNRYEAIWDEVIDALHRSGDWTMPTKLDKLLLFGTLNWTTQWFRAGAGITIEELADQTVQFLLRSAPQQRRK